MRKYAPALVLLAAVLLSLAAAPAPPLEDLKRRVASLEATTGRLETRLDRLDKALEEMRFTSLQANVPKLAGTTGQLENRLDRVERRIEDLYMRLNKP